MKPLLLALLAVISYAQTTVVLSTPMAPPDWALLERELLRANSRAAEAFAAKYLDSKGYLLHFPRWGTLDGADDAIETFHNWTLLHALGADDSVLRLFRKALEGHYEQYKNLKTTTTEIAKDGAYYREFLPMSDWFHQGEGMRGLMFLGLSEPTDAKFRERMQRFAGFYMDEDPEAKNYDPKVKIIRSLWTGSKGPMLRKATKEDWVGDPASGWFHFLHGAGGMSTMESFEKAYPEMLAHCAEYLESVGDHPLNMAATNLALNSYSVTHDPKYKKWLLEYVDAWKQRTEATGGNIPTNVGLDGKIGGEFGGKWYGGTYGWSFTIWSPEHKEKAHRNTFDAGMWPGFGNALLMSGDQKYVGTLRKQLDNLYAHAKTVDGKLMIPNMHGDQGWYNWTPNLYQHRLTEIYLWSMDRKDLERVPKKGWIGYLEGEDPQYPAKALRGDLERIRTQMVRVRTDPTTPDTRLADYPMMFNPVTTEALVNLTTGGYLTGNIWTMHCRARYFDPVKRRSGLPEDVGALVEKLSATETVLTLVNTNQTDERMVEVQAGGYGEHRWTAVTIDGKRTPVNSPVLTVRLEAGAGARLALETQRYVNDPTLAQPWDRGWMVKAAAR